ncbi:hypothetical protein ACHAXS_006795 [Conticribra weissflogii]
MKGAEFFDVDGEKIAHDENVIEEAVTFRGQLGRGARRESSHEKWRFLGSLIGHCKKLENITFCWTSIHNIEELLTAIFYAEGPYDFPLSKLEFLACDLRANGIAILLPFLKSRKQLLALHLRDISIGDEVAALIAEILDGVRIQCLDLARSYFVGEGLSAILSSKQSKCLRKISLARQRLQKTQVEEIGRFLSRNDIELECLELGHPSDFDHEKMDILFRSLQNNRTVRQLTIFGRRLTGISYGGMENDEPISDFCRTTDAIMALVCNRSTFESLCRSNHFFGTFDANDGVGSKSYEAPPFVKHALEINRNSDASTNQKLRSKLESFYFREEFDLHPFLSMKSVWVPNILEMIANSTINAEGAEEDNLSGLYRFIRNWNFPDLLLFFVSHPIKSKA